MNKTFQILNEFREWQKDWDRYDEYPNSLPRPKGANAFAEYISKKYNIDGDI